jgi:hypothetical protein
MRSATYVYGVLVGSRQPTLSGTPAGLPGAGKPRLLDAGEGLWLVAADAPLARYAADRIDHGLRDLRWVSRCALAHEAVVEHLARRATTVPMKLFTLFATDQRAVAHVQRARARLQRVAARIEGCDEWGVRVHLDEAKAARAALAGAGDVSAPASGAAFLMRKKQSADALRGVARKAAEEAEDLFAALARPAAEALERPTSHAHERTGILLDAVYLVPRTRSSVFASHARREAKRLAARGLRVTLTGPWPPYHFVKGKR